MIIDPWFPDPGLVLLYGPRKALKTWLALDLSLAIATGQPFLGWQVRQRKRVLYLNAEGSREDFERRILLLGAGRGSPARGTDWELLHLVGKCGMGGNRINLAEPTWQDSLLQTLDQLKATDSHAEVLVIDNVGTAFRGISENDNGEINTKVNYFLEEIRERGTSVVIVHHSGKSSFDTSTPRGASAFEQAVDTSIGLSQYNVANGIPEVRLTFEAERGVNTTPGVSTVRLLDGLESRDGTKRPTIRVTSDPALPPRVLLYLEACARLQPKDRAALKGEIVVSGKEVSERTVYNYGDEAHALGLVDHSFVKLLPAGQEALEVYRRTQQRRASLQPAPP